MKVVRRAAVLVPLAAVVAGGCAALHPTWTGSEAAPPSTAELGLWRRPPATAEAGDKFAAARKLRGLGRTAEAVEAVCASIDADPGFLEAHRLLQDLVSRTTGDWWLRERYERMARERPDDADSWYLLARIEPDPERQLALFSEAIARDPRHPYATLGRAVALARRGDSNAALAETRRSADFAPWLALPWLWLGSESMKRGDAATAARFFESARDRSRDDPGAWLGIAESADDLGKKDAASRAALEALRLAPGDEGIAGPATEILVRTASPAELNAALDALAEAQEDGASAATCQLLRARFYLASSRADDACAAFDAAVLAGIAPEEIAAPRRLARVLAGRFSEAVTGAVETLPREALDAQNAYAPRWRRLSAAGAADFSRPRALLELAEAMASVGWLQESRFVLGEASKAAPDDALVAARAASETRFSAFIGDIGRIARETREAGRGAGPVPRVGEVLARVAEASVRRFGRDVTRGAVIRSYPWLGEFAVSAASGGEFETTFGSHGLLCLVGAREGAAADLVVGRAVVVRGGRTAQVLDEAISFDECWIESEGLPSDAAGLRRGLAGLTLDRLVLLQLDAIRRGPRDVDPGLPYLARRAATREERRSLDTPSDVAGRIESELADRVAGGADFQSIAIDAVRRHELVHVYDASRLLPLSAHPLTALSFGLAHGFSGAAMEKSLEGRAQAFSILSSKSPRLSLAALLAFLPSRDGDTPHIGGYRDAVQAAVDLVIDDPASFPSIDPRYNVLQQLDRLSDAEIRALIRRLVSAL